MIKIGLIGSLSIHAEIFAKICNLPDGNGDYLFEDARIHAVCGIDDTPEHTEATARKGGISKIVQKPEELQEECDAVMILPRRGEEHICYALPFLKKGYPVFLDKPVCRTVRDIEILRNEISKRNGIISGGSVMKYCSTLGEIRQMISTGKLGTVSGATLNHNADIDSIYGGVFFYGSHAVEMMLALFGYEPVSVQVHVQTHDNFTVTVCYEDKIINLILNPNHNSRYITVYGERETSTFKLDDSDVFEKAMIEFVDRIRKKKTTDSIDHLVKHVEVLAAIEKSIKEKREVRI